MGVEALIPLAREADIVSARQRGRALAAEIGFGSSEQTLIATAISEVARNILQYAGHGTISLARASGAHGSGLTVIAEDRGPGIPNVERAMQDGFSTSGGLGLGLPGCKRLVDEFRLESRVGVGTTVTLTKWAHR